MLRAPAGAGKAKEVWTRARPKARRAEGENCMVEGFTMEECGVCDLRCEIAAWGCRSGRLEFDLYYLVCSIGFGRDTSTHN